MKKNLFLLLSCVLFFSSCNTADQLYPAVDIALTEKEPAMLTNEAEMNYGYTGITNQEPTKRPDIIPFTTDMGSISGGYVNGDIQPGESHKYIFTQVPYSRYYYITVALRSLSGTFDPYLTVELNGKVVAEDDNSLGEDSPGAARIPGGSGGICLSPDSPESTFVITVRDATRLGTGSYELHLFPVQKANANNCEIILP